jgi:hypothetical protein
MVMMMNANEKRVEVGWMMWRVDLDLEISTYQAEFGLPVTKQAGAERMRPTAVDKCPEQKSLSLNRATGDDRIL